MKVGAVIVTYNRLDKLKITLEKSLSNACLDRVIVVNNASTDATKDYIDTLSNEKLIVIHLAENIGGSGGFNVGMEKTLQLDIDWIVLYDDDAYPQEGTMERFVVEYENSPSDIHGVSAAVFLENGDIAEMNRPFLNPFKNIKKKGKKSRVDDSDYTAGFAINIDAATFVGFFVRMDVVRKYLGLPEKNLFIYADDLIYTSEIDRHGARLVFDPSLKFTHACKTLQNNKDVYMPVWRVYYTYRNRILFYKKISGKLYYPVVLSRLPLWLAKFVYYEDKTTFLRLLGLGVWHGLLNKRIKHDKLLKMI